MKKYIPLAIVVMLMATAWFGGLGDWATLDQFHAHKDDLLKLVANHYIASLLCFSLLYIFVTVTSIPIASVLTLASGFLYGLPVGAFVVVCSATIGATGIFLIAKSSIGQTLRNKMTGFYTKVEKDMKANALSYILFLRLVPLFPFFVVNIVPALFNVRTRDYVVATFFGILPGTIVYTNVGRSLGTIQNPSDLISADIILAFSLLGVMAVVPTLIQKYKSRKKEHAADV